MTTKNKFISGSGGGGKGGGANEAPNDLFSTQYAQIVDLLCEGEIGGLVNGEQSIFIDRTPLQNGDLSYNFESVVADWRNGTQAQTPIPGNDSIRSEIAVGAKIEQAVPIVRQITDAELDSLNVTISTPRMSSQDTSTGDLDGAKVEYTIELQSNGGGYVFINNPVQVFDMIDIVVPEDDPPQTEKVFRPANIFRISGKTLTEYKTSMNVILAGSPPWDIRVTRVTADSLLATLNHDIYFSSYTKIINTKLNYPNSALVGIKIDSKQFRKVPTRGYEVKLLKIKIPSNYDPLTRVYTGLWDGTFIVAWSDNPAWCFYDLITNDRYGLGAFIDSALTDKWALYEIAEYCDGLVPSGFLDEVSAPILEPRFTCNLYLQRRAEAYRVIRDMASIFRAILFWSSNGIGVVQDKPELVSHQFTNASVVSGVFNYEGSSIKARHTVAIITWNDPNDAYKQKLEYVEDSAGITKFGINEIQTVAMGCTSRGQAHRFGKWILFSENNETELVSFKIGLEGTQVTPGMIIRTIDSNRAGARYGGRVLNISGTTVTLDSSIVLDAGVVYAISFVLPDGTIIDKTITTAKPADTAVITIDSVFTTEPILNSVWVVTSVDLSPEEWRVISVAEDKKNLYDIVALEYNSSKYNYIEDNLALEVKQSTIINTTINAVTNFVFEESIYNMGYGNFGTRINLSWTGGDNAVKYRLKWRRGESSYNYVYTEMNDVELTGVGFGLFDFEVIAYNVLGAQSQPTELLGQYIFGVTAPPQDVPSFNAYQNGSSIVLKWGLVTDFDLDGYEIRYLESTGSGLWEDGVPLTELSKGTNITTVDIPDGNWLLMIKAVDTLGIYSVNYNSSVVNFVGGFDIIDSTSFSPDFLGTITNFVLHHTGKLVPDSQDAANIDTWDTFDITVPNPYEDCYYEVAEYDNAFDDVSRISGVITSALVPINPVGIADPHLDIDYRLEAGVYGRKGNNLLNYSEQFNNAIWLKYFNSSVVANAGISPDDTLTADQLVFDGTPNGQIPQTISGLTIGETYTFSVYVKSDGTVQQPQKIFLTGNETVFTATSVWERIELIIVATATSHAFIMLNSPAIVSSYYAWGAQVEKRSSAGAYEKTVASTGFENWSPGNTNFRYMKAKVHVETITGIAIISEFTRIIDAIETTQKQENVIIDIAGTTIIYPVQFHLAPYVDILVISATSINAVVTPKTETQFTVRLFDSSGTAVAGTIDWKAIGV